MLQRQLPDKCIKSSGSSGSMVRDAHVAACDWRLKMKAIRVHQFGGPEVLKLEDVPTPRPSAGEVLVRIHAAGVNPYDTYMRAGTYAVKPEAAHDVKKPPRKFRDRRVSAGAYRSSRSAAN